jgi:hypothetical protein
VLRRSVVSSLRRVLTTTFVVVAVLGSSAHSIAQDKELAESPDFRVRVQAALRLGRAGNPQARGELEKGLRDPHPAVRVACAVGLGNIGDPASIPPLEQAMKTETFANVKSSMKENIDKLKGKSAGGGGGGGGGGATNIGNAQYVVQLGTMRNQSGVGAPDLDSVMKQAARAKATSIKGAVVVDSSESSVVETAAKKKIPVLLVDGNLTRLTQTNSGGAIVISAKVDMSIRKVPQQVLKGTVSGNASGSDGNGKSSPEGLAQLQTRVVSGAVESAINSMGGELAALAR